MLDGRAVPRSDGGSAQVPDATVAVDGGEAGGSSPQCDMDLVVETYSQEVRPFMGGCRICHDMTVPAALLKAPGPPWFHPTDPGATVEYLLGNALVDAAEPPMSTFLLKPLPNSCGGLAHTGGDVVLCDSAAHGGMLLFLGLAAPCLAAPGDLDP